MEIISRSNLYDKQNFEKVDYLFRKYKNLLHFFNVTVIAEQWTEMNW